MKRLCLVILLGACLNAFSIGTATRADEYPPEWSTVFDTDMADAFSAQVQERWEQAANAYRAHLAKHPNDKTALYNLTVVELHLGRNEQALETSNRMLVVDPAENEAYILRAMVFEAIKAPAKAEADYAKAIELMPGARQYRYRAAFWFGQGKYAEAQRDFQTAIRLAPTVPEVYQHLALTFIKQKDYAHALETLAQGLNSLTDASQKSDLLTFRGQVYQEIHQTERALLDYQQALAIAPQNSLAYAYRAQSYFELGDLIHARADANKAVETSQNPERALLIRARVLAEDGQHREAVADYAELLGLQPDFEFVYAYRAFSLIHLNQLTQAEADLKKSVALNPKQTEAYLVMSWLQQKQNQLNRALLTLNQGLAFYPKDFKLLARRGVVRLLLGQKQAGLADLGQACQTGDSAACQLLRAPQTADLVRQPERFCALVNCQTINTP